MNMQKTMSHQTKYHRENVSDFFHQKEDFIILFFDVQMTNSSIGSGRNNLHVLSMRYFLLY